MQSSLTGPAWMCLSQQAFWLSPGDAKVAKLFWVCWPPEAPWTATNPKHWNQKQLLQTLNPLNNTQWPCACKGCLHQANLIHRTGAHVAWKDVYQKADLLKSAGNFPLMAQAIIIQLWGAECMNIAFSVSTLMQLYKVERSIWHKSQGTLTKRQSSFNGDKKLSNRPGNPTTKVSNQDWAAHGDSSLRYLSIHNVYILHKCLIP